MEKSARDKTGRESFVLIVKYWRFQEINHHHHFDNNGLLSNVNTDFTLCKIPMAQ